LLIAAVLSAVIYITRIRLLRPDAWENLTHAFVVRLGYGNSVGFTEFEWVKRTLDVLLVHFLPIGWVLAVAGAVIAFRARQRDEGLRWICRACLCLFVMDALFVGLFQNDSYIHPYIAFYLVVPVAITAGIALDSLIAFFQRRVAPRTFAAVGEVSACLVVLAIGACGMLQTRALQKQFHILSYNTPEPSTLIPELGNAIRNDFPPGTHILCNFLPEYGPQFEYYAQRDILNNLSNYRCWRGYLNDSSKSIGGVVWMTAQASQNLIAKLPPGSKRFLIVGNLSFCLWKRSHITHKITVPGH
jgi:hypothetical protein